MKISIQLTISISLLFFAELLAEISISKIYDKLHSVNNCFNFINRVDLENVQIDERLHQLSKHNISAIHCIINIPHYIYDNVPEPWISNGNCSGTTSCQLKGANEELGLFPIKEKANSATFAKQHGAIGRLLYIPSNTLMKGRPDVTECCCALADCVTKVLTDSYIGWHIPRQSKNCAVASYDNFRTPNWDFEKERQVDTDCQYNSLFGHHRRQYCHMKIRRAALVDPRSRANVSRVFMSLGCGCPERGPIKIERKDYVIHLDNDEEMYCCQGFDCNRELYRRFGFEILQNDAAMFEKEIRARLDYEAALKADKHLGTEDHENETKKEVYTISHCLMATFFVVIILVLLTNVENIEDRKVDLSIYNDVLAANDAKKKEDAALELDGPL